MTPMSNHQTSSRFQNEMRSHGVDWEMTVYGGAVHSFTDVSAGSDAKTGAAYNEKADARSFQSLHGPTERPLP